jgi:hypothetical protein
VSGSEGNKIEGKKIRSLEGKKTEGEKLRKDLYV